MKMNRRPVSRVVAVTPKLLALLLVTTTVLCHTVEAFTSVLNNNKKVMRHSSQPRPEFRLHLSSISAPPQASTNNENNDRPVLRRDGPTDSTTSVATMTTTTTTAPVNANNNNNNNNNIEANVYMKNLLQTRWMELPASSTSIWKDREQQRQLDVLEQMIGRIAMMGAIGIVLRELNDGQSILEQVMNIV